MKPFVQILHNLNIITSKGKVNPKIENILKKNEHIREELIQQTSFLDQLINWRVRIYCVVNGITSSPKCKSCMNLTTFNNGYGTFNKYCTQNCAWNDPDNTNNVKITKQERYGNKNYNNRDQAEQTNLERYGTKVPTQNQEIKDKIRNKITPTKQLIMTSNTRATILKKYNRETFASGQISDETNNILRNNPELLKKYHHIDRVSLTEIAIMLGTSIMTISRWFTHHNIDINYNCSYTSTHEKDLRTVVESILPINTPIVYNSRKIIAPYEIDIFIPTLNLAIEYCGVFWHSETYGKKDRKYHLNKYDLCKAKGITLIQIWSSEWVNTREIVISRLQSKLQLTSNVLFARKCTIDSVPTSTERTFFDTTHIQGYASSNICYGLWNNGDLVASMSFSTNRFNDDMEYELLRYSCKLGYSIPGGASRLFKHFIKQHTPISIVTYSNKRWNTGYVYEQLQFTYSHSSTPGYYYFNTNGNTNQLFHRIKFQKHKLVSILDNFDNDLSEYENMVNNGYDRIWDCGNDVWKWGASTV